MQSKLDALSKHASHLLTSADLWNTPLPPELSDSFGMTGEVTMHPGRREVHVHLTDAPLLMQNTKLRDAFYLRSGIRYATTGEYEKMNPATTPHQVLSEGTLLWVAAPDGTPYAALTQRSIKNPGTGEMVNSPGAWQNPRGKTQDQRTYLTEAGEEQLFIMERQNSTGQIGLTALTLTFNGQNSVTEAEKRDQLQTYEAYLNSTRGPQNTFKAEAVGIESKSAILHEPSLEHAWKIVTYINNSKVREIPGLPLITRETNSFEFSVPMILQNVTTKGLQLVAMEPGPQQPTAFMTLDEMMAMPLAAKRPKVGEPIGGLNQALFGPLRDMQIDTQLKTFNRNYGHIFDTSHMPKVA